MKSLLIYLGTFALSNCARMRGFISEQPITIDTGSISQIPFSSTYQTYQIPTSSIYSSYPYNGNIGQVYAMIPQMQIPTINYAQTLAGFSGVENLTSNSVSTNSQNSIANTSASNGSNANTSMNNNAVSTTINGVSVQPSSDLFRTISG